MKVFLILFILVFNLQSLSKADDIRDLEIEGMSIGNSLLDFYSKKETQESLIYNYTSDKYETAEFSSKGSANLETYDAIHINFLKADKKKIIHAIHGLKDYNDIKKCIEDKKNIVTNIKKLLTNIDVDEYKQKHTQDKSGKSFTYDTFIITESNNYVSISCYDWSSDLGFQDHLRIAIVTKPFMDWINDEAYK